MADKEYSFVITLADTAVVTTEAEYERAIFKVEHALLSVNCDEATIVLRDGSIFLHFTRAAISLEAAVDSATEIVVKAGLTPTGHRILPDYPIYGTFAGTDEGRQAFEEGWKHNESGYRRLADHDKKEHGDV